MRTFEVVAVTRFAKDGVRIDFAENMMAQYITIHGDDVFIRTGKPVLREEDMEDEFKSNVTCKYTVKRGDDCLVPSWAPTRFVSNVIDVYKPDTTAHFRL